MIKNYFITAWRRLKKSKFYTIVNILGLSVSLTAAILIILWVKDERSFDKFHPDYEHIYVVNSHLHTGDNKQVWPSTPGPVALYAQELSSVKAVTRYTNTWATLINDTNQLKVNDKEVIYADESFFSIFNFPLIAGTTKTWNSNLHDALITELTARQLFGTSNAVGKLFRWNDDLFTVQGVLADIPQNSSIKFDAVIPLKLYAQQFGGNGEWKTIDEDLGNYSFSTYIKLQPTADHATIAESLSETFKKARNGEAFSTFVLDSLQNEHLISPEGNKAALRIVQIFTIIAVLLLIIGAVNYINLSTARSIERAKGVAVRRVIGASRKQLFLQFVMETCLIFLISTLLALILVSVLTPGYNSISSKSLAFSLHDSAIWLYIGSAIVGTLLLASIYPALQLSSFHAVNALKGHVRQSFSNESLRKGLVIFQFTISVILIICTLVIRNQLQFIRQLNLGYDKEHVFTVNLPSKALEQANSIKSELQNSPAIQGTSLSSFYNLLDYHNSTGDIDWPGKPTNSQFLVARATVDENFIPLMGLELTEGSNFSGLPADSSAYIVNEALIKEMGLKPPYVGTDISLHDNPGKITGIVRDFHFKSAKSEIGPMVLWSNGWAGTLYVKTTAENAQQALAAVENIYNQYPTDSPFSYKFLDTQFDALYRSDNRTGTLFNLFSAIAIFISTLGLLALTTYSAQTRVKEIGIRKVLGSSSFGIVKLLGKEFIVLVLIAIVIACPIAFYFMKEWLNNFAYKTDLKIPIFLIGGVIAVSIAALTISFQAFKAARANPVDSLKDE